MLKIFLRYAFQFNQVAISDVAKAACCGLLPNVVVQLYVFGVGGRLVPVGVGEDEHHRHQVRCYIRNRRRESNGRNLHTNENPISVCIAAPGHG